MADSGPDAFKVERRPAGAARSRQQTLMVNFDLPRSPVRLEQRIRRVRRTGQSREYRIFNFYANNTIEGKLLRRLVNKLEQMKDGLGGRVL